MKQHMDEPLIDEPILHEHGARLIPIAKDEFVFRQGDRASNFWIVQSGRVRMASVSEEGKEFVQGYFTAGQSFGEPPFFNGVPYPASAIATETSAVWRCPQDMFLQMLRQHPDVHLRLTRALSSRLVYKSMMLSEIAVEEAEHRLLTLIDYFRQAAGPVADSAYVVPFTRQQLADMTGLRVETVIRCVKSMEQKRLLRLGEGGKIQREGPG